MSVIDKMVGVFISNLHCWFPWFPDNALGFVTLRWLWGGKGTSQSHAESEIRIPGLDSQQTALSAPSHAGTLISLQWHFSHASLMASCRQDDPSDKISCRSSWCVPSVLPQWQGCGGRGGGGRAAKSSWPHFPSDLIIQASGIVNITAIAIMRA